MNAPRYAASILLATALCLASPSYAASLMTGLFAYDPNNFSDRLIHLWLPLFVIALVFSFLSARYVPLGKKETIGTRLYRDSPRRYVFVLFCCAFAVLSIIEDLGALLVGRGTQIPTPDRYVLAIYIAVGSAFRYWLLSHKASKLGNKTGAASLSEQRPS